MQITINQLIKKLQEAKAENGGDCLVEFYDHDAPTTEFNFFDGYFNAPIGTSTGSRTVVEGNGVEIKKKALRFCINRIM